MTELDLGLKVDSRRLLWSMNHATRVDVPLRTAIPSSAGALSKHETFTDLDVLGVTIVPGFDIRTVIADCKTSQRGSTERMFWIRGVATFFNSDDSWMVREKPVTAASRQLADKLGISVLEPADLKLLESFHPSPLDFTGPLSVLFDQIEVEKYLKAFDSLDRRLTKLVEFRQFDFWVAEPHRNLQQVVAQLQAASKLLDPVQPNHRALLLDCVWLYVLSLARASRHVRTVHIQAVDVSLQQYLFGGQAGLQEKQALAKVIQKLAPSSLLGDDGVLPSWYPMLLELLIRHLRRPGSLLQELQIAEWMGAAQISRDRSTAERAFGASLDPVAAKLLNDVAGFLITAANLDPGFRSAFSNILFPDSPARQQFISETSSDAILDGVTEGHD